MGFKARTKRSWSEIGWAPKETLATTAMEIEPTRSPSMRTLEPGWSGLHSNDPNPETVGGAGFVRRRITLTVESE